MKVSIGLGFSLLVTATASAMGCAGANGPDQEATRSENSALTVTPVPTVVTPVAPRDAGTATTTPTTAPTTAPTCPPQLAPLPRPCSDPASQTYVLRLADTDGAPTYSDGFMVPFPTPWAADAAKEDKSLQPIVDYETLLAKIPSAQRFEFLVKTVTVDGGRLIRTEGTHQFFVVGISNPADAAQALANAALSPYPAPPVEAQILKCVHIVDRDSQNPQIYHDTNIFFPVADLHDPSTHPNYQLSNGVGQPVQQPGNGGGSAPPVEPAP